MVLTAETQPQGTTHTVAKHAISTIQKNYNNHTPFPTNTKEMPCSDYKSYRVAKIDISQKNIYIQIKLGTKQLFLLFISQISSWSLNKNFYFVWETAAA